MVSLHRNKNITKTEKRWFQGMPIAATCQIVEDFGTLDSESEHSRKHLMGHPSMDEQDSRAEGCADYGDSVQCFRGEQ